MAPRPPLARLSARPHAGDWGLDELMTLAEAAALLFPRGPLTPSTLRLACRRGELSNVVICGRTFTSRRAVDGMSEPTRDGAVQAVRRPGTGLVGADVECHLAEIERRLSKRGVAKS